jgi:RNA polymerase sigma-70 factor, ECF subfamily
LPVEELRLSDNRFRVDLTQGLSHGRDSMEFSASQSTDRLIERARQESRSAMDLLMASCRSWLHQKARMRLPGALAQKLEPSDLVQECLHRAVVHFSQFQGGSRGEFRAWLASIMRNQLLQMMRFWSADRRDHNREEPLSPGGHPWDEPPAASTSIVDRLSREEDCERLKVALSWCRAEDQAVIEMHFLQGQTHEEIAAAVGSAPAAVRQRASRAVRRLRKALEFQERMTERGLGTLQRDALGLQRFGGTTPRQIAERLQLPEELVKGWIAMAQPFLREIAEDEP